MATNTLIAMSPSESRRKFLAFLAASPLFAGSDDLLTDPKDAINVFDFEAVARKVLPPAHWGYLSTGVDDDTTLKANREGYQRLFLRPRRLIDISKVDTRTEIFGVTWESPIGFSPIGNTMAFHPEAELAVAKAAKAKQAMQILSTNANTSYENVSETLGRPAWYQLYTTTRWDVTERLVRRVEAAGCPVVLVTVDTQAGRHTETAERSRRLDSRDCKSCHGTSRADFYRRKPMFKGLDVTDLGGTNPAMTWEHVKRLRDMTKMKLLIKGIEAGEDAELCLKAGMDGVVVSNHGGRAEESGRGTIDCLPEVVDAVKGRVPVLIDGGIRRGTDVFKALALGASAVCIGRPYIWGLAGFGQSGVERVLEILRIEFSLVMKQCGARSISEITRQSVGYHSTRSMG